MEDAREMREAKERQEEAKAKSRRQDQELMGSLPERERRLFKEDGTPTQMNTAKWPFSIEEDELHVIVDVALPRFLDSAAVRRLYSSAAAGRCWCGCWCALWQVDAKVRPYPYPYP